LYIAEHLFEQKSFLLFPILLLCFLKDFPQFLHFTSFDPNPLFSKLELTPQETEQKFPVSFDFGLRALFIATFCLKNFILQ
tara:strand:+ start:47975 stop:48217 length:243 start_codon:yes stop_codon:yes gene_type:complete